MQKLFNLTSLFPKALLHSKIYIYLRATPGNLILFLLAQMSHPLILFKKITHKHRKTQMHLFCTLRPGLKSVKRVLLCVRGQSVLYQWSVSTMTVVGQLWQFNSAECAAAQGPWSSDIDGRLCDHVIVRQKLGTD